MGFPDRVVVNKNGIFSLSVDSLRHHGEDVFRQGSMYLRAWEPKRSKLAACMKKGLKSFPFEEDSRLLYLGASSGTTVSHLSDVLINGRIYAVEVSYDSFLKLMELAAKRKNVLPIMEDANLVERYGFFVEAPDTLYQDISQRNQIQIFNRTTEYFPSIERGILIVKARSISSRKKDQEILREAVSGIRNFMVKQAIDLAPYSIGNYLLHVERL